MAEAYYGVPDDIATSALAYLDPDLRAIYEEWQQLSEGAATWKPATWQATG